jgi:hypothetical protein
MSSKNRHDTRMTPVLNIVYVFVYVVVYVVVEPWNVLLLCGGEAVLSRNHTTAKTDLPLYSSFVYGDQSS